MINFKKNRLNYLLLTSVFSLLSFSTQALVVLQYHHVDEGTPSSTSVSPEQFLQHMQLIEDLGLKVVDLESASHALLKSETKNVQANSIKNNQVAISFDDAYYSIFANAYPELKRRNWPFTIFVNTQAVNEKNRGIMSWQQIKQLVNEGVSIANHSVSHAHLPSTPKGMSLDQWLEQEISQAQQELQRRLGKVGNILAYPYGEFTLEMTLWLDEQGMLAFGQQSGPIGVLSHPQALPRFPASGIYADLTSLKTKLLSLALPVEQAQLKNPIIDEDNNPPGLSIVILDADYNPAGLQCFASQQGAIPTQIKTSADQRILSTQAPSPLIGKRGRYNCTVLSGHKDRFYWYSQPWQMY
jgi:peptidoglycan/xylan/chitin deacetylase (PgdA/CDA1 family)